MKHDRDQHNPGAPHLGPVTPPSLGEVYEISTRRQRTRYRFIQGTLVAVAVAGVGVGLQTRGGDSIQSPAGTGEQADATDDGESNEPDPEEEAATEDTADTVDTEDTAGTADPGDSAEDLAAQAAARSEARVDCPAGVSVEGTAAWMADARAAYLESSTVPMTELEQLAAQWQIPVDEVQGLAGVADDLDASLVVETLDEAFFDWYEQGYSGLQLNVLASEWNVSTISVKVLQLLGGPVADASLAECGLS